MLFEVAVQHSDSSVHFVCCRFGVLQARGSQILAFCGIDLTGCPEVSEAVTCVECVRIVAWNPSCTSCPQRWATR